MTVLQLTDGKEIRVSQTYEQVRDLLKAALAEGAWLEIRNDEAGDVVGINPANVSYIKNTNNEGPGPADADWEGSHLTREREPA